MMFYAKSRREIQGPISAMFIRFVILLLGALAIDGGFSVLGVALSSSAPAVKFGIFLIFLGITWSALIVGEHLFRPRWQTKRRFLERDLTSRKIITLSVLAFLISGCFFLCLLAGPPLLDSGSFKVGAFLMVMGLLWLPTIVYIYRARVTKRERLAREWTIEKTLDVILAALVISGGLYFWLFADSSAANNFSVGMILLIMGSSLLANITVRYFYPFAIADQPVFIRVIFEILSKLEAT